MPTYKHLFHYSPSSFPTGSRLSPFRLTIRPILIDKPGKIKTNIATTASHRRTTTLARRNSIQNRSRITGSASTRALKSAGLISFLSSFFTSTARSEEPEAKMSYTDNRSDKEWRAVLSPEQFRVLREKGTESPFTGEYDKHYPSEGVYTCAGCNAPLYKASHKFKSGCGWPAYFDSIPGAVTRHTDNAFGMQRTEIVCSNCGGHLGHVFKGEGFSTPTDERHCVNSISLKFSEDGPQKEGTNENDSKV